MSLADILDYIKTAGFGVLQSSCEIQVSSFMRFLMVAFFFLDWFWGPLDLLASSSSPVCIHCCHQKSHLFVIWLHVFCSIFSHVIVVQSLHIIVTTFLLFLSQSCWCSRLANHKFHSECIVYMCGHWIYQRETIHSLMNAARCRSEAATAGEMPVTSNPTCVPGVFSVELFEGLVGRWCYKKQYVQHHMQGSKSGSNRSPPHTGLEPKAEEQVKRNEGTGSTKETVQALHSSVIMCDHEWIFHCIYPRSGSFVSTKHRMQHCTCILYT